jgi:glycosyltransferase involved in cell wall biosynthesis
MLKETDWIITVSESIKSWYTAHHPGLPVTVLYNSPPYAAQGKVGPFASKRLTACYEGNISEKKASTSTIFRIAEVCSSRIPFRFKIIGGMRDGNRLAVPDHLRKRIISTGWVDYSTIPSHMSDVDIGWMDYDLLGSLNHMYAMPNKFFSYLNNGIPVVVNRGCDMENFVRTHHVGLVIDKLKPTPEEYAEAFLYLYRNKKLLEKMSANARAVMRKKYSWERMELQLYDAYERLGSEKTGYIL